jgi:hypothetical protein
MLTHIDSELESAGADCASGHKPDEATGTLVAIELPSTPSLSSIVRVLTAQFGIPLGSRFNRD